MAVFRKNTVLFGTVNYPKKGQKVFIQFSKALLPDGREVELKAQALNAKDYSPGLEGKLHSGTTARVAGNARADDGISVHRYTHRKTSIGQ